MAIVPFRFGGIEAWLGGFLWEQPDTLKCNCFVIHSIISLPSVRTRPRAGGREGGGRTSKVIPPILPLAKRAQWSATEGIPYIRLQVLCVPSSKAHNEGSVPMVGGCFAMFCESISLRWVDAYCVDEEPRWLVGKGTMRGHWCSVCKAQHNEGLTLVSVMGEYQTHVL